MAAVEWGSNQMVAVYIAAGVVVAGLVTWLVMRRTVRTRIRTERELRDDPDINDWLVIFDWTRKALYVPTIAAALLACVAMYLCSLGWLPRETTPRVVGGAWLAVFLVNFLIEEFQISVKIVVIIALCGLALFLWLHLLGWSGACVARLGRISVAINATGYLVVALVGLVAIGVSWLKGLFYYVVFTPNYMNIQWGPTESGDHISREDYNTHVDTEDVLERLMGFGRIVIVFKDQKRPPLVLLVWRIGRRAKMLERVRGKFAIDMNAHGRGPHPPAPPAAQGPAAQSEPE